MITPTIAWRNNSVRFIDQTLLPGKFKVVTCRDLPALWKAIRQLKVRGAPALGVAAAFGVLLGMKSCKAKTRAAFDLHISKVCQYIGSSRPTAVNLFYALDRMRNVLKRCRSLSVDDMKTVLKDVAFQMYEEDRVVCRQMGAHGAALVKNGSNCLTVCNAGALATVDYGTALGVFYSARRAKKHFRVYACETRPLLQGARLTAWELLRANINTTLICDNMAASLMQKGKIDAVFAGADRIAANGDTANKIGTYSLAVLARHHKIPFYIVAPRSTFDLAIPSGRGIPIEERDAREVRSFGGRQVAPQRVNVYNPAFDVTPRRLISAIVTEKGIVRPPFGKNIKCIFKESASVARGEMPS